MINTYDTLLKDAVASKGHSHVATREGRVLAKFQPSNSYMCRHPTDMKEEKKGDAPKNEITISFFFLEFDVFFYLHHKYRRTGDK